MLKCLKDDLAIQAGRISELESEKSKILSQIKVQKNDSVQEILKYVTLAHKKAKKSVKRF